MESHVSLHRRLVALWRAAHPHVVLPLRHTCSSSSCSVVRIGGFACAACGVHLGPRALCASCRPLQNSYICMQTGFDHHCGAACNAAASTQRGGLCPISGQAVTRGATQASTFLPVHARSRHRRQLPARWAQDLLHRLLFSAERVSFERHRRNQLRVSAERAVHRHRRACHQDGRAPTYLDMALIYMRRYQRCKPLLHPQLPRARQLAACERYSTLLHEIMRILGKRESESIAIVLLYLMRSGVTVESVSVLPRHLFLATALPDAHSIGAILGSATTTFTSEKNKLQAFLRTIGAAEMTALRACFTRFS